MVNFITCIPPFSHSPCTLPSQEVWDDASPDDFDLVDTNVIQPMDTLHLRFDPGSLHAKASQWGFDPRHVEGYDKDGEVKFRCRHCKNFALENLTWSMFKKHIATHCSVLHPKEDVYAAYKTADGTRYECPWCFESYLANKQGGATVPFTKHLGKVCSY